ncbi:hypothetical protein ScPMuIL_010437 [Solemya velum]
MLQPLMNVLKTKRIILASGSPRRKQILTNIGLKFEIESSSFEENLDKSLFPEPPQYAVENAFQKTMEVARRLSSDPNPPDLLIGADTIVTMDGVIYEKPRDEEDAFNMLSRFSGRQHTVYTGLVLATPESNPGPNGDKFRVSKFYESTDVIMAQMTPELIRQYIATGEPMDKAGGYGIQGLGGTLVAGIKGDYFNVMGFPLHRFAKELVQIYESKK